MSIHHFVRYSFRKTAGRSRRCSVAAPVGDSCHNNVHYYVYSTSSPVASHYLAAMGVSDYFIAFSAKFWERLRFPSKFTRDLVWGIILGITVSLSSTSAALILQEWRRKRAVQRIPPRPIELRSDEIVPGVTGLIGSHRSFQTILVI